MNGPLYKNTDPGDGTVVNVSFWSCLAAPRPDEKESGELLTREGTDKLKLVTAADRAGQWVPEGGEGEASSPLSHSPKPWGPGLPPPTGSRKPVLPAGSGSQQVQSTGLYLWGFPPTTQGARPGALRLTGLPGQVILHSPQAFWALLSQ